MAQTKKKRRRKHRGTQAGTIDRAGRTGRPQTRADARSISQQRRQERLEREPTLRGAVNRAAVAAIIFGLVIVLAFDESPVAGASLAAFMLVFYIPMSYYTDRLLWRRRQRKAAGVPDRKPRSRGDD